MGRLTTHVLDTMHGTPGRNITVRLFKIIADGLPELVLETRTNEDGRCDAPLLENSAFEKGTYRLQFAVGDYFRKCGVAVPDPAFLDLVTVDFGIADAEVHYHVPLLVSPFGYSTYRGS